MFDMNDLNPVERMIMKRVTKYMNENGVKYVGIFIDADDKPGFEVYNEPVKVFTLTQARELLKIIEELKEKPQIEQPKNLLDNGNA